MTLVSDPIIRRKLSDEVFDRLKAFITTGELQPGDSMPSERDIMERFGVGRPAIREAMRQLSNMGEMKKIYWAGGKQPSKGQTDDSAQHG